MQAGDEIEAASPAITFMFCEYGSKLIIESRIIYPGTVPEDFTGDLIQKKIMIGIGEPFVSFFKSGDDMGEEEWQRAVYCIAVFPDIQTEAFSDLIWIIMRHQIQYSAHSHTREIASLRYMIIAPEPDHDPDPACSQTAGTDPQSG
jgi:hypothetical protein